MINSPYQSGQGGNKEWILKLLEILGNPTEDIRRGIGSEQFASQQETNQKSHLSDVVAGLSQEEKDWLRKKNRESAAKKQAEKGTPTVVPTTATKKYVTTPDGPKWVENKGQWLDREVYVQPQPSANIPYSDDGYAQDEILAKFKEMNPRAFMSPTYDEGFIGPPDRSVSDRVAAQAIKMGGGGGISVPGGTFSQMPDTRPPAQSDEAYYDAVDKLVYEQELRSRQDPRSRGYDPTTAQQMIDAKIAEQEAEASAVFGKSQMIKALAEEGQLNLARRAMEMENTPIGRARAITPVILQSISQTDPDMARTLVQAVYLINSDDKMMQLKGLEILDSLNIGGGGAQQQVNQTGQPQ